MEVVAKSVTEWMSQRGMTVEHLIGATSLDRKVLEAIIAGRWTASPQQRARLAAALGVEVDQIQWGHTAAVDHMYGHGPQFGRSP